MPQPDYLSGIGKHPFHPFNQAQIAITASGLLNWTLTGFLACGGLRGICPDQSAGVLTPSDDPRPAAGALFQAEPGRVIALASATTTAPALVADSVYRYWEYPSLRQQAGLSPALLAMLSSPQDELPQPPGSLGQD